MKKFPVLIVFCLAICISAFAQTPAEALEKLRQVKLLESTRDDVRRIFAGYKENPYRIDISHFPARYYSFSIHYSSGSCAGEDEDWNIPEGRVTSIRIFFNKTVKPESLGINLSALSKEKMFVDSTEDYIYHDKNAGLSYHVCNGEIVSIELFPPKENLPLLCGNKTERKKFYERKRWQDKRSKRPIIRTFANVNEMTLSTNEITANCDSGDSSGARNCTDGARLIEVQVEAEAAPCSSWDFTYNYTVSGGKIIGQGEKVVWDLSRAKPGKYTITAGVDNGCGVCGTTKTQEVTVNECADCGQK